MTPEEKKAFEIRLARIEAHIANLVNVFSHYTSVNNGFGEATNSIEAQFAKDMAELKEQIESPTNKLVIVPGITPPMPPNGRS